VTAAGFNAIVSKTEAAGGGGMDVDLGDEQMISTVLPLLSVVSVVVTFSRIGMTQTMRYSVEI
jgi:hypothetical protein